MQTGTSSSRQARQRAALADERQAERTRVAAQRGTGLLLVFVSAIVFSSAGLFVKGVTADAWAILFWRGLSAALITSAFVAWRRRTRPEFVRMGRSGVAAAVVGAAATAAFIPAFKHTSIANVTLIYAAVPFAAAVIGWLWMRERPTRAVLAASLLAFSGVLVIVYGSLAGLSLKGDLLALCMTVGMATMLCIYRRFPETPAAGPAVLSSLLLVPPAWFLGNPLAASTHDILVTGLFGVVFSLASVTLAEGARRLPAAETALISSLETPLAPLWAYLLFAEVPSAFTLIGGSVILVAVFGSQRPAHKLPHPPA